MYLELAENKNDISQFYISVPSANGPVSVREDLLDDLNDDDFEALQSYAEVTEGMSGKRSEERRKRREERRKAKIEKKEAKTAIKLAKAEKVKAGGGGEWLGKVGDIAGKILGPGAEDEAGAYPPEGATTETAKPPYLLYAAGAAALGLVIFMVMKKK